MREREREREMRDEIQRRWHSTKSKVVVGFDWWLSLFSTLLLCFLFRRLHFGNRRWVPSQNHIYCRQVAYLPMPLPWRGIYRLVAGSLNWLSLNLRMKYLPLLSKVVLPLASLAWSRLRPSLSLKHVADLYKIWIKNALSHAVVLDPLLSAWNRSLSSFVWC